MLVSSGFIFPGVVDSSPAPAVSKESGLSVEISVSKSEEWVTIINVALSGPWSGETGDCSSCLELVAPSLGISMVWES